jgi:nicotinamidase-related amidase
MDAVNLGYQFVMPRDAVAGIPEDYAEQVLDHTISLLATLPSTDDVLAAWSH